MIIVDHYIDKAYSGTTEERPSLQRMMEESHDDKFDVVLVYKFDRFARNQKIAINYKDELKNRGVSVISVTEPIDASASGAMMEGILDLWADYFARQNRERVIHGMKKSAGKCKFLGGPRPFGFSVDEHNDYQINEEEAPVVYEIFHRYSNGETAASIMNSLNGRGIVNAQGRKWGSNSLQNLLRNDKYIGTYTWGDTVIEHGIPSLVEEDVFGVVQQLLKKSERRGGHYKADPEDEYILTGKLFCGECGTKMIGTSAVNRHGTLYRYYKCPCKDCSRKTVSKEYIEEVVFEFCCSFFTSEMIDLIAKETVAQSINKSVDLEIKRLDRLLKTKENQIEKLLDSIEQGVPADRIAKRVKEREKEISEVKSQIAVQKAMRSDLTEEKVKFFLTDLIEGYTDDWKYRKLLIDMLVSKVILYDDRLTISFDFDGKQAKARLDYTEGDQVDGVWINPLALHHSNR